MNNFRKATIIVGLIAITIITLMTACSSLPKQVSADASSSGKQIEIAVGGSIAVTLDSNATTGYTLNQRFSYNQPHQQGENKLMIRGKTSVKIMVAVVY
jgi:hypothetical protein